MINWGASEFPEKWRVGIDLVPVLSQSARNLLYIQIVFDSVPLCVCEESFPNFRSFRTSCRLLHILLTSPSKAWIFWHKKCFAESEKISRAFSGNGLLLLNLLTLFIFTFYCLGAPKRKEATFEFLCPIHFGNICGLQLSLGLLLAHVGQNNCDKTD